MKQSYFYPIRISLVLVICFHLILGCSSPNGPILNPEPFGKLFEARNNVLSAAETLKKQAPPSEAENGRQLYNAAADEINALLDESVLAVYSRATISKSFVSDFKNRLERAVKATEDFQKFVVKAVGTGGRRYNVVLPVPIGTLDIAALIDKANAALQNARQVNQQQRDKIANVLESLKLVPFDQVGLVPESKKPATNTPAANH